MKKLIEGIERFRHETYPQQRDRFQALDAGQSPETLLITCSDSRIDPNLITQTGPGELFVIRNAGNIVPPYDPSRAGGESATLEYAVMALGVKEIIVCGHSQCGAMKGLMHPEAVTSLPQVADWLRQVEQNTKAVPVDLEDDNPADESERLLQTIRHNVLVQMANLQTHPSVQQALADGKVRLWGWVYHIATGEVEAYDPQSKRFQSLSSAGQTGG